MSDAAQPNAAQSVREDIAFMRSLAEEGRDGPVLGGSFLVATGVIYAAACAAQWLVLNRLPEAGAGRWMTGIIEAAVLVHVACMVVLGMRLRRRRVGTIDRTNRVFAWVWNSVGIAVFACLASFFLTARLAHTPEVFAGWPTVLMALYGVGWTTTAAATRKPWTWGVAILSYLFAVVAGAFAGNANLLLVFALALLLLLAAPGAILIKQARP
jgi:hypothetical protein